MRYFLTPLLLCTLLLPSLALAEKEAVSPLQLGRDAPWIAAFSADNKPLTLAAMSRARGKRGVVTQFWASWCAPCVKELEAIAASKEKFDEAGITVFLVNLNFSEKDNGAARLVERLKLNRFPLAYDRTGAVARAVGLSSDIDEPIQLPLTLVTNSSQQIKLVLREAPKNYVEKLIAALKDERPRP